MCNEKRNGLKETWRTERVKKRVWRNKTGMEESKRKERRRRDCKKLVRRVG